MKKLVLGHGYLGSRVARRWSEQGDQVTAVTRHPHRCEEISTGGATPIVADLTQPLSPNMLGNPQTVLFAVGYDRQSSQSIEEVYLGALRNTLAVLPDSVEHFLYISTTGVYGDSEEEWLDENSPTEPARAGGQAHLAAEQLLRESELGPKGVILRLAGLYGPDRLPFQRELLAGNPLPTNETAWLNLIHVDDAAQAVLAAEHRAPLPRTYAITDGHPVSRRDFYEHLSQLLTVPPPTFAPDAATGRRARSGRGKRISNQRMLQELQLELLCPSYREGLTQVFQEGRHEKS